MKIAILGIQGIPNNYGGFETLTENLVEHLSDEFDITVYCSSKDIKDKQDTYKGAKLKYIPITSHGAMGILYDSLSLLDALKNADKILILGFGAGFVMPFISKHRLKIIVNMGGLDWKRNKWSWLAQQVIHRSERLLLKYCGTIISDNIAIRQYIKKEYNRESTFIAYGGDQATKQECTPDLLLKYPFLKSNYAFAVTRIQPDNNIDMILDAFDNKELLPLVMVGNWDSSEFGRKTKAKYQYKKGLILLDAIYDRKILDCLRGNCSIYIHGHSAGGTNPSLVEAMYLGLPVFAFASGYNEYTTENAAIYFKNEQELTRLVKNYLSLDITSVGIKLKAIANKLYRWETVCKQYKEVFLG